MGEVPCRRVLGEDTTVGKPKRAANELAKPTRERILTAALHLFARKGFAAVGIREIALEANLSSAALYHYVGSKNDLLVIIMKDRLTRLTGLVQQAAAGISRPEDQLVTLTRVHTLTHAVHPDTVVDDQLSDVSEDARKEIVTLRDEYESIWRTVLEAGLTPPAVFHPANPALARLAMLGMCNAISHWYSPEGAYTPEEIAEYFAQFVLDLAGARRGERRIRLSQTHGLPVDECRILVDKAYAT